MVEVEAHADNLSRRAFLKTALATSVVAAAGVALPSIPKIRGMDTQAQTSSQSTTSTINAPPYLAKEFQMRAGDAVFISDFQFDFQSIGPQSQYPLINIAITENAISPNGTESGQLLYQGGLSTGSPVEVLGIFNQSYQDNPELLVAVLKKMSYRTNYNEESAIVELILPNSPAQVPLKKGDTLQKGNFSITIDDIFWNAGNYSQWGAVISVRYQNPTATTPIVQVENISAGGDYQFGTTEDILELKMNGVDIADNMSDSTVSVTAVNINLSSSAQAAKRR